jgi:single-strand DNA-binding protein
MAAFNKIILLGNLTRAPTFRTTSKGTPVCNRSLAANHKFSLNGGTRQKICFSDVAVFDAQVGRAAKVLGKGAWSSSKVA